MQVVKKVMHTNQIWLYSNFYNRRLCLRILPLVPLSWSTILHFCFCILATSEQFFASLLKTLATKHIEKKSN